ncbi:transglutaminase domain-containing protein [Lysinibacter sp. HNR]|uniref:DUF3488 and transglutaminase-like domain-containing protein n=1 Tax=Lysinibacter sp. HNR TaxID=3031408 RepID=UPI0024358D3B|nr:transglutaminase domain-containing protein [Lysinibacter sp. HNR]WGD37989.1 transglutaminase domain-containing protein [Lysinibacter sp. HNR]
MRRTTRRPLTRDVLGNGAFFALTMAVAIGSLWPIYQHPRMLVTLGLALIAGSIVAIIGALARVRAWLIVVITLLLYVLLGAGVAVPHYSIWGFIPSLRGAHELLLATVLGWKRLLTIDAPVGQYEALLVPPFVLVLLGTVIGLSVMLRSSLLQAAGIIAPITVFLFGIVYGVAHVRSPIPGLLPEQWLMIQGFCGLALAVVWMLWRARRRRSRITALASSRDGAPTVSAQGVWPRIRPALAAVIVLVIGGGVAAGAVSVTAPSSPRDVLRDSVQRPFDPRDYASPLSGFRDYLSDEKISETMFTVDGFPAGERIRIATLDTYDGVLYRVGSPDSPSKTSDFTRVPFRIDQSARGGESTEVAVGIEAYTGVWVPTTGWLESISFAGTRASQLSNSFFYNAAGGTAAVTTGLRGGDSYTLRAVLTEQPSVAELAGLTPGTDSVPDTVEMPPVIGSTLRQWAGDTVRGDTVPPGEKLVSAIEKLGEGYISHGAEGEPYSRSGHGLDRIIQFLESPILLGDAEQYAVTLSLLAQEMGYPARVIFGFVPEEGSRTVRGENVSAWTEINTRERGWVTVDPTPEWREVPEESPQEPERVSNPLSVPPPPPPETDDTVVPYRPEGEDREQDGGMPTWLVVFLAVLLILGWVLLVLLVIALPFALILWAKRRRRLARERASDPLARMTGAWREAVDIAVDHGEPRPGSLTRLEYANALGNNRVRELARAVDRAVFNASVVDPEAVEDSWSAVRLLRHNWDNKLTRRQRLASLFSLRSFGLGRRVQHPKTGDASKTVMGAGEAEPDSDTLTSTG